MCLISIWTAQYRPIRISVTRVLASLLVPRSFHRFRPFFRPRGFSHTRLLTLFAGQPCSPMCVNCPRSLQIRVFVQKGCPSLLSIGCYSLTLFGHLQSLSFLIQTPPVLAKPPPCISTPVPQVPSLHPRCSHPAASPLTPCFKRLL